MSQASTHRVRRLFITLSKGERFYWLLILPSLIVFLCIGIYPFAYTLILSMQTNGQFTVLHNYVELLSSSLVRQAIRNTVIFVLGSVFLEFVIGFISALIMNASIKGRTIVRMISFLPWAIPVVVAGITFKFMFSDMGGIINTLLMKLRVIDFPIAWVADKKYAMWALIVADSWKSFPIIAFLLLAGLQQLPRELFEAARVDGATGIRTFIYITLPLLRRVIFVALMIRSMQAVAYAFDMVYSLTKGGPGDATQVLVTLARKYSFQFMQFERGATVAILALLTGLVLGGGFLVLILREAKK